jgi:cell division protein ZipA
MDVDTEPLDIESIDEDIDEPASGTSAPGFPAQHSEVPDAKVSVPDMRVAASTTPQSRATGAPRREPGLGPMQRADIARASVRPEPSLPDGRQSPEPNIEKGGLDDAGPRDLEDRAKRVFAVRLVAPSGHRYSGKDLMAQFNSQRLEHGRYGIFHSIGHSGNSIFSVASMIEPGTFDLDSIAGTEYPGLTLFTLVGSSDDARSVEALLECATNLQRSLGGTFQDERGTGISSSRLDEMRLQARSAGT